MIKVSLPLISKQEAITHPVAMAILKDIKLMTTGRQVIPVRVAYKSTELINKNWMLKNIKERDLHKTYHTMLTATYNTKYDEHSGLADLKTNDSIPVIYDNETGLLLRPLRMETTGTLEITLLNKSKGELESIVSKLRRRKLADKQQSNHTVNYMYSLSTNMISMLEIYMAYRKDVLGIDETLIDYLNRVTDTRVTYVTDQSNQGPLEIGFKEVLTGVLGYFDTDLLDLQISFDNGTGFWTTGFSYIYKYQTIDSLDLTYEPVIYNKLLPTIYRTLYSPDNEVSGNLPLSQGAMLDGTIFMKKKLDEVNKKGNASIVIPNFDKPPKLVIPPLGTQVISILCLINKLDKRNLFNLTDLGDIKIRDELITYIQQHELPYLNIDLESIFKLSLYDERGNLIPIKLLIDANLNVSSPVDLSLLKTYRVVISMIYDITELSYKAYDRYKSYYPFKNELKKILVDALNSPITDSPIVQISDTMKITKLQGVTSQISTHMLTMKE